MQICLQVGNNLFRLQARQCETADGFGLFDTLNQVVSEDDLTGKQSTAILLFLTVAATRCIHTPVLDLGAEIIDPTDGCRVIGKVVSAMIRNITQEEGDGKWSTFESESVVRQFKLQT